MFSRASLQCGELLGEGEIAVPTATAPLSFEELPRSFLQALHQQFPELQFLHDVANFCSLLLFGDSGRLRESALCFALHAPGGQCCQAASPRLVATVYL